MTGKLPQYDKQFYEQMLQSMYARVWFWNIWYRLTGRGNTGWPCLYMNHETVFCPECAREANVVVSIIGPISGNPFRRPFWGKYYGCRSLKCRWWSGWLTKPPERDIYGVVAIKNDRIVWTNDQRRRGQFCSRGKAA